MLIYKLFIKRIDDNTFISYLPAFDNYTEGDTLYDCIQMSKDMLGALYLTNEDLGIKNPEIDVDVEYDIEFEFDYETIIDIDKEHYRKLVNNKSIKKNCSIPYWMELEAEKLNINYSQLLQSAIEKEINKKLH